VRPGSRKEIGWYPVSLDPTAAGDPLFRGLPDSFSALHWHGDVFDLPSGAQSLARSEITQHQAFAFGGRAYGLLFHLEVGFPQLARMVSTFDEELRAAAISGDRILQDARTHAPAAELVGRQVFGRWLELVRGQGFV
jgi:GMP synthase (glutamine-hydrolysing)